MSKSKFKGLKRAVVKEEFVALTGDLEKAIILNQFIYWSERVKDFDQFINEEQGRNEREGLDDINIELQNGWIYKDMEELKGEIMVTSSISTMSRKLKELVERGWMDRRNNPKYKWDKRYQYRVNLIKITTDLFEIGYILQDYKINMAELLKNAILQNENSILQNENSDFHNDKALSEITSEITSETTSETINHSIIKEKQEKQKEQKQKTDDGLNEIINNLNLSSLETKDRARVLKAIKVLYSSKKDILSNGISIKPNEIREDLKRLQYKPT